LYREKLKFDIEKKLKKLKSESIKIPTKPLKNQGSKKIQPD